MRFGLAMDSLATICGFQRNPPALIDVLCKMIWVMFLNRLWWAESRLLWSLHFLEVSFYDIRPSFQRERCVVPFLVNFFPFSVVTYLSCWWLESIFFGINLLEGYGFMAIGELIVDGQTTIGWETMWCSGYDSLALCSGSIRGLDNGDDTFTRWRWSVRSMTSGVTTRDNILVPYIPLGTDTI